jgi:hypothetical protein
MIAGGAWQLSYDSYLISSTPPALAAKATVVRLRKLREDIAKEAAL